MTHQSVEVVGFQFQIDEIDSLGLLATGEFEPETLAAIKRIAQPGQRVIDVGANIGFFTAYLSRLVGPDGYVVAVEPHGDNFRLLTENIRMNRLANVKAIKVAAGEVEGSASLFLSDWNGGMHRLYESQCCTDNAESVRVMPLDAIAGDDTIDLIKIDIEGYEFFALKGAERCLRMNQRIQIVSEYCAVSAIEAGASPLGLLLYLESLGFSPFTLDGNTVNVDELKEEAVKYEGYGRDRMVSECVGMATPEILATMILIREELGCRRPILENLIFSR